MESFYVQNEVEKQCRGCHYFQWYGLFKQKCKVECEFKSLGDIFKRKVYYQLRKK